jgi:cardiolipin synthase
LTVLAVTHAVLDKRDVRAAIGWVGLILFVPVFGAILYYLLGINRIHRRAKARFGDRTRFMQDLSASAFDVSRLAKRPDLQRLANLVERVTERPLLAGNEITPLVNGEEAYPQMLAAIAGARHSITLCTYIFDNDPAGETFVAALAAAVQRGVEVRVLVDDAGTRYTFPSIVRKLRRANVTYGRFMPSIFPGYLPYMNLRNHRKIMVVDGDVGFTGGMNIRRGHWIDLPGKRKIQDLHFRVRGPIVAQLQAVFAEDWSFTKREVLQGKRWFPPQSAAGDIPARGVVDGPNERIEAINWTLFGAIASAQTSIRIVTPYFLPEPPLISALTVAAMRGVDVEILLPEENNLKLVQWASTPVLPDLIAHGVKVFLGGPPFDHSKFMLVDDFWTFFGSSNLDPRSLRLNFEFNIEAYSAPYAAKMAGVWRQKMARARPVTLPELRGRPFVLKVRDGFARLLAPYL